jgi:hypothetical protein
MSIEPRVVTFFVRCPDPLGLPEKAAQYIEGQQLLSGFANVALHIDTDGTPVFLHSAPDKMFVSARFHFGRRSKSLIYASLDEMNSVLSKVLPADVGLELTKDETSSEQLDAWATFSMAELTTPVAARDDGGVYTPCEPTEDVLAEAFERSVEALFLIIRAYRFSVKRVMHTPTRERLGQNFYVVTRKATPEGDYWDEPGRLMVNILGIPAMRPAEIDADGIERLGMAVYSELFGHPMVPFSELQADARSSLADGDYRASVMLFHSASEVYLDTTLMLMQWEEGLAPETAAEVFRRSLMERVRSQYHDRLGGTWATRQGTAVDSWYRDLVLLRHRTIHGGYAVSPPEAHVASSAFDAFRTFVTDRIAANVKRYPVTSGIVVSEEGFRRRGNLTNAIRRALQTPTRETFGQFHGWRSRLIDLRANQ